MVRLTLKTPNASILQILALRDVPVISKEWVEAGHDYRREYNGTGAFKMVKAVRGEQYQLVRHDKYWKTGLPYLEALEFRVIPDPFTRADGVRAGEIDLADFLPWQEGDAFAKNAKLQTVKSWSVFNAIILNPKCKPFDDVWTGTSINYDDPDALGNFYESTGAFYGRAHDFKDAEIDALFAKGRATPVAEERAKIYCELERQALDKGYWALITWRPDMFGLRADVKGFAKMPGILSSLTPTSLEQTWLAR